MLFFLDIEMPMYAGFEIVNFFDEITFEIIFVTAYDKYAVRAFEISAFDYLLKPIEVSSLKITLEKLLKNQKLKKIESNLETLKENIYSDKLNKIIVKNNNDYSSVYIKDINRYSSSRIIL